LANPPPRSFLTAVAGIALVLVAGELVVRAALESPSPAEPVARFELAYAAHTRIVQSSEGYGIRRTNSLGLLDDELRVPRPARRVLLMGDSYAEAMQVPQDSAFADVAERLLPGTEIVNAGVSGHSPLDHAEWLETRGANLEPDVIVVEMADANLDRLLQPESLARFSSPPVPGVIEPAPVETGLPAFMRQVRRHSALITLCSRRLKLLTNEQRAALSRRFRQASPRSVVRTQSAAVLDPRMPGMLDSLHTRIARYAPRVVYVYIPHLEYFAPGIPESDPVLARLLRDLCARRGATMLDTGGAMRAEFRRSGQPLHGFQNSVMGSGHINAAGHRVVGQELARVLAELGP
jgi:hypothetical protein